MLDWNDLRYFLAVTRRGSLTGAAKDLGVTQSTVGRRLAVLETHLGARLFERTSDGYVATAAASSILARLEHVEAEVAAVQHGIGGRDQRLEGTVRVAASELLVTRLLTPVVSRLQASHPNISVELVLEVEPINLCMHEADVAVRPTRFEQSGVLARRIGNLAYGLYASRAYLDNYGAPNFTAGCPGHRIITELPGCKGDPVASWLSQLASEAKVSLRTDSLEARCQLALDGQGLVALPRLRGELEAGRLQLLPVPDEAPAAELWLGVQRDNRDVPRVRLVLDTIAAVVSGLTKPTSTTPATPPRPLLPVGALRAAPRNDSELLGRPVDGQGRSARH